MIVARMLTQEGDGIGGYMAHPEGPGQRPGILMVFSDANHGFRHPDNAGFQPYYADLAWPLVTSFLQRTV